MKKTFKNIGIIKNDIRARSTVKVLKKNNQAKATNHNSIADDDNSGKEFHNNAEYRQNEMSIQMLSKSLHDQIFKGCISQKLHPKATEKFVKNLKSFGLQPGTSCKQPDINVQLPPLKGTNIEEHFYEVGKEQCKPYSDLIDQLLTVSISQMPEQWAMTPGWTKYELNKEPVSVEYPEENILIFDVEVCMSEGSAPTIACALGPNCWYSWASESVISVEKTKRLQSVSESVRFYSDSEFIPMESATDVKARNTPKLIIGHNVSYDRARIKDQYRPNSSGMRFLDTMSLHVCVSGITSYQRAILKSKAKMSSEDEQWASQSSLNSLSEVYKLYCGNNTDTLNKDARSVFVSGTLEDVHQSFQALMKYCALDVLATFEVFRKLYPLYCSRFPHPVTFAGMLELGMAYLPVNVNWARYINDANLIYEDLNIESNYLLSKRANQACRLFHNNAYLEDLWMWDQDWSIKQIKLKVAKKISKRKMDKADLPSISTSKNEVEPKNEMDRLTEQFNYLFEKSSLLPVRIPDLAGYPEWYRKLCLKTSDRSWKPGPVSIGTGMQVCPKLLALCWEGYPLHFIRGQGWGFLVPFNNCSTDEYTGKVPLKQLIEKCNIMFPETAANSSELDHAFKDLKKNVEDNLGRKEYFPQAKKYPRKHVYKGTGVQCDIEVDNACWFFRLPHKDGQANRVGNPLARDFVVKFSENVLSGDNETAERVTKIARMLSYWRNNRERIINQLVVVHGAQILPNPKKNLDKGNVGAAAILPQVVACGTLTRRAMEPTWMTASNVQEDRVGSELRSMVQVPKGYRMVGADVDSQELWIASLLGDASQTGIHGATPLGWMTLNGTKSNGTDMHSITAKAVGISRNHAKILNYARIYGAGQTFAARLLKQFNPTISDAEAKSKAIKMFKITKGQKMYAPKQDYKHVVEDRGYWKSEAFKIAQKRNKPISEMFEEGKWYGGMESAMFNYLEHIAGMPQPTTPFLNGQLSRALVCNSGSEQHFLPTKINWVVQSGAVDFLHLMLVCMRWLMNTKVRFCLSFHDEIRYITKEEYAYQTALAMHITNLLTRSFCASRLGLNDLPQSVAFFASVEVDTVLRKESQLDCKTPSNLHGLQSNYGIPNGESLDISEAILKANGHDLSKWPWHKT